MTAWVIGGIVAYLFLGGVTYQVAGEVDGFPEDKDAREGMAAFCTFLWPVLLAVVIGEGFVMASRFAGSLPFRAYRALRASHAQVDQLPEARVVEREKP